MKPHTIEILTNMIIEEIKGELKTLSDLAESSDCCSTEDLRDAATSCRNIIDVAEALENVLLTAAEELDRLESEILNGEQSDEPTGILGDSATKAAEALAKCGEAFVKCGEAFVIGRKNGSDHFNRGESIKILNQKKHSEAHTWPK